MSGEAVTSHDLVQKVLTKFHDLNQLEASIDKFRPSNILPPPSFEHASLHIPAAVSSPPAIQHHNHPSTSTTTLRTTTNRKEAAVPSHDTIDLSELRYRSSQMRSLV